MVKFAAKCGETPTGWNTGSHCRRRTGASTMKHGAFLSAQTVPENKSRRILANFDCSKKTHFGPILAHFGLLAASGPTAVSVYPPPGVSSPLQLEWTAKSAVLP